MTLGLPGSLLLAPARAQPPLLLPGYLVARLRPALPGVEIVALCGPDPPAPVGVAPAELDLAVAARAANEDFLVTGLGVVSVLLAPIGHGDRATNRAA